MSGLSLFTGPSWGLMVEAFLHTLWQGALISVLLALALHRLRGDRRRTRYGLAVAAQFGVLLAGLMTWAWLEPPRYFEPMAMQQPHAALPSSSITDSAWVPALAIGWLVGVGLMLLKTGGAIVSAHRLTRGPRVTEPRILALLDRLRSELGIRRPIQAVANEAIGGPAVLGLIRPTLILPMSLITGLPPDAVRAILAHELAHVRRHDYAVNLVQMFVESLLFFNPTVWWLGRQARLEREACSDALAVRVLGSPRAYSHALAEWAGVMSAPLGVPGWNGDGRPSTLLERIRRVLRPGDRVEPQPVSWVGALFLLAGGPILLAALFHGTLLGIDLATGKTGNSVNPQAPSPSESQAKVVLKGTIRASSGDSSRSQIHFAHAAFTDNGGGSSMVIGPRTDFAVELRPGENWIVASADEYAPALAGPFNAENGQPTEDLPIVLDAGFPYRVRFVDLQGEPIQGVNVRAEVRCGKLGARVASGWITGPDGVAIIPHASKFTYDFFPTLHNFNFPDDAFEATPEPGGETTFTLQRGTTSGIVIDAQGRPVPDATLWILAEFDHDSQNMKLSAYDGQLLTKSDADGRFALKHLHESSIYWIRVESQAQELGLLEDVRLGATGLTAVVHASPPIRGVVKGDLENLLFLSTGSNIHVGQYLPMGSRAGGDRQETASRHQIGTSVSVNANGEFECKLQMPLAATLKLGDQVVQVPFPFPKEPIVFELPEKRDAVMRGVELRLSRVRGKLPPDGSISLLMESETAERNLLERKIAFHDGHAHFEARVGSRVSYSYAAVPGYWAVSESLVITPGSGEQFAEVSIAPVGSIEGRILNPDGAPIAEDVKLSCVVVKPPPAQQKFGPTPIGKPQVDAEGRYTLSSLPLGGTYVLYTEYGHIRQASEPIQLEESEPTIKLDIHLPPQFAVSGRVLNPDGQPVFDMLLVLQRLHPSEGMTWPPGIRTDQEGRFQFDDLGAGMEGYLVRLNYRKDFQPVTQPLQPGGPPIEIRLDRGNVLEGRLVEAVTGWPIPGVEFAAVLPGQDGRWEYQAEAATDEDGRFRFSNLPAATVRLKDYASLTWQDPQIRDFEAGKTPPVTIRATLRSSSKFKPTPPKK